jgi:hypothetical protein
MACSGIALAFIKYEDKRYLKFYQLFKTMLKIFSFLSLVFVA